MTTIKPNNSAMHAHAHDKPNSNQTIEIIDGVKNRTRDFLELVKEYVKGSPEELEVALERGASDAHALFAKTGNPLMLRDEFTGHKINDAEAMGWNSVVLGTRDVEAQARVKRKLLGLGDS